MSAPRGEPGPPSLLAPAAVFLAVLVAGKAVLLGAPEDASWIPRLVAITGQDALAAALYAGLGALLLRALPRPHLSWRLLVGAGAVFIVFAVIHVGFYESFRRAITVQMFRFSGNVSDLRSSVVSRLSWPYAVSLSLLPLAFVTAFRRPAPASRRAAHAGAALLVALWVAGGQSLLAGYEEWMERMAQNPHLVIATSLFAELRGSAGVALPRDFAPADLHEFRTVAERGAPDPGPAPGRVKNVLVVVMESVGVRELSLYGSALGITPHLAAAAEDALVFDAFHAHVGLTYCSFMSLTFSIYPGLPWCYVPCGTRPWPETLPGILGARGHRTAFLSSADMSYEGMAWAAEHNGYQKVGSYYSLGCPRLTSWGGTDTCLFDGVFRFLDEAPGTPFYVVAWTGQTHDPYALSPGQVPFDLGEPGASDRERYLAILRGLDADIGRLLDGLRARGLADDSLVVITGDHGEAFGEPHDYRGHGSVLFDENVRVPLLLWNPRLFHGAGRSARVGGHVDLNPTIAHLLGVPDAAGWQGRSLFAPDRPDRAYFFSGLGDFQFGVREGRHKYVYSATFGRERLYDVEADPGEQVDLSGQDPERAQALRRRVAAWIAAEEQFLRSP